jgi:hypothetical protein
MFAIQAVHGSRRWIPGVFDSKGAADAYFALIPHKAREKQCVIHLPGLDYPLYLCEDERGFRFLSAAAVIAELKKYAGDLRRDVEDWNYTNVYRIASDWRPKRPGTDYMGALPHHHVTNETIRCVEEYGFESLWG